MHLTFISGFLRVPGRIIAVVLIGTNAPVAKCALIPYTSTGAEGVFHPFTDVVLTAGTHNFTSITIPSGVHVTFSGNSPTLLLATGVVAIDGSINLSGMNSGGGGAIGLFSPTNITITGAVISNGTNAGGGGAIFLGSSGGTITISGGTLQALPDVGDASTSAIGAIYIIANSLTNSGGTLNPPLNANVNSNQYGLATHDTFGTVHLANVGVFPGNTAVFGVGAGGRIYVTDDSLPPIYLKDAVILPGAFQFGFTNNPSTAFTVSVTTNVSSALSNWIVLSGVVEISPGQFQFTDREARNFSQRFYRVHSP